MSEHYEKHADEVSSTFIAMLDDDVRARISHEHRKELTMLVEAAISTAVLEQLERAADQVAKLSDQLRKHAEHYDKA
jgi:hypothetical protein